jgi:flagellar biosynthetic protein FlhB
MADPRKTEKPTPKRRQEARKKGQIPRTQELGQWLTVLLLSMAIGPLLKHEIGVWEDTMTGCFRAIQDPQPAVALDLLGAAMKHAFMAVVTLGLIVMAVGVLSSVAQGGFVLATKALKPNFGKLNLIKGFKQHLLSPQVLWNAAKTLLKSAVVGLIGYAAIRSIMPLLGGLMPMSTVVEVVQQRSLSLLRTVGMVGLVLAGADYAVTRRRSATNMLMTKQEVKDEARNSEGDPKVKNAIRSRQMAISRSRMIAAVADADVLLVNPTHVAVALKYDPLQGAPRVVARGAGAIAARIRATAEEARVPLVRDVPLARALYRSCEVGQEIPRELFAAVAQVLAFVISRRTHGQYGGEHRSPRHESELPPVPVAGRRRRDSPGRNGRNTGQ